MDTVMADHSLFDRNRIQEKAQVETEGLLEHLNLPPAVIAFIRRNQRTIWIVTAVVAAIVVTGALYSSYREYRVNKAVSALDGALQASAAQREERLAQVAETYASTPAAVWARIELARIFADKKDVGAALSELARVDARISDRDPLKPLVIYRQGALSEEKGDLENAAKFYARLTGFPGFEADGHYALGRVERARGDRARAETEYQQFMSLTADKEGRAQGDPRRELVEALIKEMAAGNGDTANH